LRVYLYRVLFRRYKLLKLPWSCKIVEKRWFLGPGFVGECDIQNFGQAFSNYTYFRPCGQMWLSSVQRAPRVADEKRKKERKMKNPWLNISPPTTMGGLISVRQNKLRIYGNVPTLLLISFAVIVQYRSRTDLLKSFFECRGCRGHVMRVERHATGINCCCKHTFLLQLSNETGDSVGRSRHCDSVQWIMTSRYDAFRTATMCLVPRHSYSDTDWLHSATAHTVHFCE